MSLNVTEPIKTVNGMLTEALAAESQLLYLAQREDYEFQDIRVDDVAPPLARVILQPALGDLSSQFTIGDLIYIFDPAGTYTGLTTVTRIAFSGSTNLTIDKDFSTTSTLGYVNNQTARPNYRILLTVYDAVLGVIMFDDSFVYVPNQAGFASIDVNGVVLTYMKAVTDAISQQYYLETTEVWEGRVFNYTFNSVANVGNVAFDIDTSFGIDLRSIFFVGQIINIIFDDTAIPYVDGNYSIVAITFPAATRTRLEINYLFPGVAVPDTGSFTVIPLQLSTLQATFGQKQLLDLGGANMWERLLRQTGIATGNSLGKLLTVFENPIIWRDWNRTASYLMDQNYVDRTGLASHRLHGIYLDVNKTQINSNFVTPGSIDFTPTIIIAGLIAPTFNNIFYYGVEAGDNTPTATTSERLDYKIECEPDNPICLDWINSAGGIDQHVFSGSQIIQINQDAGLVAESPIISDIETIVRTKRRFSRAFRERITLRANSLTEDQILALEEIKRTESLRVYLTKDGSEFIDAIIVEDFLTSRKTSNNLYNFSCIIEFPDNFRFELGKKY